ncbi:unnamed protein product [Cuscuta campestris]|uniref:Uncharacterized protein n=1 Tax=Cuscuta campestris TaxID=132261 RepID=A0A484K4C2_9ASTE|nr:unnamed protein product [Cuscuta campestris]
MGFWGILLDELWRIETLGAEIVFTFQISRPQGLGHGSIVVRFCYFIQQMPQKAWLAGPWWCHPSSPYV